jgi:uncharacterized protein (TIGR02611 family)
VRPLRIVGGFVLLAGGVLMLVTPGPGWLAIAGGLSLLAVDFPWARRLLDRLKQRVEKLRG